MSGNNQPGASVCCLFVFVLFMMAIVYFIYGALPLAIGGAILIPTVILIFYANKKSKQKNRQTSSNTSTDEYKKWKRNALAQRQEKETSEGQQSNNQTNQQPSTDRTEKELEKDSVEDSEGDGLMLFDDPLFPPEFDDEDDDL
jgi:flagellar biosynthesis component FlhA